MYKITGTLVGCYDEKTGGIYHKTAYARNKFTLFFKKLSMMITFDWVTVEIVEELLAVAV